MRKFTQVLGELAGALDPAGGWYAVFLRRDPEGMDACFRGREVLPWDVTEALLQDVAALHGIPAAEQLYGRVREAYRPAVAAYDARPGGRQALLDRLDATIRERRYAEMRRRRLAGAAPGSAPAADGGARTGAELAWAEDDVRRAAARCAELRRRLEALETPDVPEAAAPAGPAGAAPGNPEPAAAGPGRFRPAAEAVPAGDAGPGTASPSPAGQGGAAAGRTGEPSSRRRAAPKRTTRPRGARFAGLETTETEEDGNTGPAVPPVLPGPPAAPATAPRGARFAGAYGAGDEDSERGERASARDREDRAAARAEARDTAVRLRALRAAGRSGEAYALLSEAVSRPPARLPLLAAELEREGLAAEVATLLWEAAALPPPALAATAGALADAGRGDDCRALLSQCAGRPAAEVADTALALRAAGRHDETAVLLGGMLRARTDEHAARVAEAAPGELVPPLLEAVAGSPQRYRNLAHVLRGAGLPGIPDTG
ncbi:hypothetical protein KBZ10_26025 [Streptomyces sp. F63]|uniref:hypothetical protein n=1 Tax=Streptomyces sp. F63 TaxID=2824887 RepID=UPI001B35F9BF|nr:hypothetical protein [Streptomyces sp. F63]MBQ0987913.1 hypothetical protein [Streptomyces sp. F63]